MSYLCYLLCLIYCKEDARRQWKTLKNIKKRPANEAIDKNNHQLKQQRARQAKYLESRMKTEKKQIAFSNSKGTKTRNSIETRSIQ